MITKCSKCGIEIDDHMVYCPYCGKLVNEVPDDQSIEADCLIRCKECGNDIPKGSTVCPICGFPLEEDIDELTNAYEKTISATTRKNSSDLTIGILMCLLAIVCLVIAVARITNDNYKFYLQHYQTCLAGYNDAKAEADKFSYGYFKSAYEAIADDYKDMMNDDKKEIWTYRGWAIVFGCAGAILLVQGGKSIFKYKESKNGTNAMP